MGKLQRSGDQQIIGFDRVPDRGLHLGSGGYTSVALVCETDGYDTLRQARAAIKSKMQNGLFAIALSVEGETLSTT